MKKIIFALLSLLLLVFQTKAQTTSSSHILNEQTDVRLAAMGGGVYGESKAISIYNTPSSIFYNGNGKDKKQQKNKIAVGYSLNILPEMAKQRQRIQSLSVGMKMSRKDAVFIGVRHFKGLDISLVNDYEESVGNISLFDYTIDMGYSRLINERFSLSAFGSYVYSYRGVRANAFGFSVIANYRDKFKIGESDAKYIIGLGLENVGSKMQFDKNYSESLPTAIITGGEVDFELSSLHNIKANASMRYLLSGETEKGLSMGLGAEYGFQKRYFFRLGYAMLGERNYLNVGIGYDIRRLSLNIAYRIGMGETRSNIAFSVGVNI